MLLKSIEGYRMNIRTSVRGLWSGVYDYYRFKDQMSLAIERGFTQAWYEGAKIYGINPGELTQEEHDALTAEVNKEIGFVDALGQAIMANQKAFGGKLKPLFARAELWVSAYNRVRILGSSYAAKDQKHIWNLGPTKEHCRDCSKYQGKVHRYSVWRKYNALPKAWELYCHGIHCECSLDPTDLPATPGRPPSPSGG
jgi:uncharacterized protein YbdZ (MbtH family)